MNGHSLGTWSLPFKLEIAVAFFKSLYWLFITLTLAVHFKDCSLSLIGTFPHYVKTFRIDAIKLDNRLLFAIQEKKDYIMYDIYKYSYTYDTQSDKYDKQLQRHNTFWKSIFILRTIL